jgi:hypothetical protein
MYFLIIMPSRLLKSHVGRTPGRIFSKFFTLGQVIETVRGGGIFQPAIDEAIKKLQAGDWVSIGPRPVVDIHGADVSSLTALSGPHLPGRKGQSSLAASPRWTDTLQMGNVRHTGATTCGKRD